MAAKAPLRNMARKPPQNPPQDLQSTGSMTVLDDAARPTPAKAALVDMGQAGDRDALARLNEAMKELKALAAAPLLRRAIDALNRENFTAGGKWALKALEQDDRNGVAWYLLAISRERAGDFTNSVKAYEAALQLLPNHSEVANDLGRLAHRMGMHQQAEKLFRHYMEHAPHEAQGYNNLATSVKDQGRVDEAVEILRAAITAMPESSMLWNTLGTVMIEGGDLANAATFIAEAVRLDPKFNKGRYNLSQVKLHLGEVEDALVDCEAALAKTATADDREMMKLARSSYQLALGRLGPGWDDYEARLSPQFADVTHFAIDRPRWAPGQDIAGKDFLVVGEQGLGDEVLFANVLPDIVRDLGPDGRLRIAVEPRLVDLFRRSFPGAEVSAHVTRVWATKPLRLVPGTDLETVDLWTPMASLMRQYRRTLADYPTDPAGYMAADPERVAHWRRLLADAGPAPKVGLLWKSAVTAGHRHRYFSPFEQWAPVLRTPGVAFVNLQYGDCEAELEQARRDLGVEIWSPPGIDLKKDLDDVTALACAMDLVIGFSNATFNLGAAAGAPSWLISAPGAWPRLGLTETYAWYPQARVFVPDAYQDWGPVFARIAGDLAARVAAG